MGSPSSSSLHGMTRDMPLLLIAVSGISLKCLDIQPSELNFLFYI